MKDNNIQINGSSNNVLQDVENSKVSINDKSKAFTNADTIGKWTFIATLVGVTIAIIVGWEAILKFFGYAG